MKLETYQYSSNSGWDNELDGSLDSDKTLLMFFGSPHFDIISDQVAELSSKFPESIMIGCSSAGEIYDDDVYDESISLSVSKFEHTDIRVTNSDIDDSGDSFKTGQSIAEQLLTDDLRSIIVLSDGLAVNGSKLIEGMTDVLPEHVVITGGLAGDGDRFESTWVWSDGQKSSNRICAVGFYGEHIGIGHGSRGGWDMLGPERKVTRSEGNVLFELDNQPALELYKKYLGDRADGLPATGLLFPLSINNEDDDGHNTVRTILAVSEEDNSITFAGDIPEGKRVRLMRANFDRLIDGAADASDCIDTSSYEQGPLLGISISCVGRRLVLGPRTEEEIDAALSGMPDGTRQIGFYSYGEISPLANGRCDLHNQTMTLTLIWENERAA